MFRKLSLLIVSFALVSMLAAGCGGGGGGGGGGAANGNTADNAPNNGATTGGGGGGKQVTLRIFQFKVEIAEAFERMRKEYEKEHPNVRIAVETVGGGSDYGAALKAKFASGDEPDIFNNGGYQELKTWLPRLEDLSDQPWVGDVLDVAKDPMMSGGKMYGMPVNVEGLGFIYNKALFKQAGITDPPNTLSELRAACDKLKAAGITPFANGYGEWWVLGNHNFNVAVAQQPDPDAFVAAMNNGTGKIPGNPVFEKWADLLDLTLKYSNPNPLTTDYNTQVTLFASGQAAMMQQGNWTQVQINGINPDLDLGVLPMPIDDDEAKNDKLYVGVPNNWVINKNSPVKEQAKEFLNWLVTSETGKRYIVEEFKFIPAFKTITVENEETLGDIANAIITYNQAGKVLPWQWFKYPEGVVMELGSAMQAYIAGKSSREQMFQSFQNSWDNLRPK